MALNAEASIYTPGESLTRKATVLVERSIPAKRPQQDERGDIEIVLVSSQMAATESERIVAMEHDQHNLTLD